jgi:O-antigen/teichoic acid export membrane protein
MAPSMMHIFKQQADGSKVSETYTTSLQVAGRSSPVASLRWNFSWTLVGNLVYSGSRWGMLVLLAKLSSPVLVGQYSLGLAIATPILLFSNLNLRCVQTTDVEEQTPFSHYLGFRIATTAAALLIILVILVLMKTGLNTTVLLFMVALSQAVESISDVYYGRMQLHDRMDNIAKSMIARGPLSLLALAVILSATRNLFWSVAGVIAVRFIVLFSYDARSKVHGLGLLTCSHRADDPSAPVWDGSSYLGLAKFCAPLGIISLLASLNSQVPRYFIQGSLGTSAVGIFSAMAFLTSSGTLIVQALGQSAFVQMAKNFAQGRSHAFKGLLGRLLVLAGLLGLSGLFLSVFAGRELLTLIYRPEYAAHLSLFVLIMAAGVLDYLSSVIGFAVTSARAFYPQIPLLSAVTVAALVSSFFFIRSNGMIGAGYATICTSLTLFVGEIILLARVLHERRAIIEPLPIS